MGADFIGFFKSIFAGTPTATGSNDPVYSDWVDRSGFGGVAFVVAVVAISASIGGVITLEASNSAAGSHSDKVDVTRNVYGSDAVYANTASLTIDDTENATYEIQYNGNYKYVRAKITPVGNTDELTCVVNALKFRPISSSDGR